MSEVTDLTVIEIKPEQAPVLYVAGGLDAYLEQIRQAVNEVPDLSTKKGRDRWAMETDYVYPGPIQYFGPTEVCDQAIKEKSHSQSFTGISQ